VPGALARVVLAASCAALCGGAVNAMAGGAEALSATRQQELIRLLRQDCGSCHGLRLTGGLGPPLTQEALKDRPQETVAATIEHGRPGTPMPSWRPFMSDAEAQWLAARLKEGIADAR
jgi:cytochrome c55X